jgi:hypothetical protein
MESYRDMKKIGSHMAVSLSALGAGPALVTRNIPGTYFCYKLIDPTVIIRVGQWDGMKNPRTLSGSELATFLLTNYATASPLLLPRITFFLFSYE